MLTDKIKILYENSSEPIYDHSWIGSDPSKAFLLCISSAPWKMSRRKRSRRRKIQEEAIKWLGNRDLIDMRYPHRQLFPFKWQNYMLFCVISSLNQKYGITFKDVCNRWMSNIEGVYRYTRKPDQPIWIKNIEDFFYICGRSPNGTKVLWMFVRDFLQLPAFPIDRHIHRTLYGYGLPCDSWKMVKLCREVNIDPNELNRRLFPGRNPDWNLC